MTENPTTATLNPDYFMPGQQSGPRYPYLQATTYSPSTFTKKQVGSLPPESWVEKNGAYYERPQLAMTADCVDLLDKPGFDALGLEAESFSFGGEETTLFVFPAGIRFTVLAQPRLFKLDKETGKVSALLKGDKFAGTKLVTASRLLLGMVLPSGDLVLGDNSEPQIVTLKLTSSKTRLLGNSREAASDTKTIYSMNEAVAKHYKAPRGTWVGHMVSLDLFPYPHLFSGKDGDSVGIMFGIGNAKPLPETAQAQNFKLVSEPWFKGLAEDPFGITKEVDAPFRAERVNRPATSAAPEPANFDDIPF